MKLSKSLFVFILTLICFIGSAQISSYEEMEFESDSVKNSYRPVRKNFAYIKSKKGTGGVNRVPKADSILEVPITEIVLVFTETTPGAIETREESNRERWENLFETYPEFFQHNGTTLKNICQCNQQGDAEAFKQSQGFYVYFAGPEPKSTPVAENKAEPVKENKPVAETKPVKEDKPAKEEKPVKSEPAKQAETQPVKQAEPVRQAEPEPVKQVAKKEEPKVKEEPEEVAEEPVAAAPKPAKTKAPAGKKRPGYEKPRRARDAKACRQPCYETGDDDLNNYFKSSITLTKKQKRKGKNISIMVRIQLNYDGTIKKAFVQGEDAVLTQQVQGAVDNMSPWNPAVKNGVTVKSEVKFFLKYDKPSKSLRASDFVINPRPGTKCPCVSDAEMFGD